MSAQVFQNSGNIPDPSGCFTSLALYQSERLSAYAERLIHAFTGKPATFGGPGFAREDVLENRRRLCERFGLAADRLIVPDQVHSDAIRSNRETDFAKTDAVTLLAPGVPVMLLYADCVPVMLYDPARHVGAVIHAGWRGTALAIAAKTARWLGAHAGTRREDLIAVVGPAIGGCCFEVSPEVAEALTASTATPPEAYVTRSPNDRPVVDIKRLNALQLQAEGVGAIEIVPACTRCEVDALWSYRRGENGRQAALMCLL